MRKYLVASALTLFAILTNPVQATVSLAIGSTAGYLTNLTITGNNTQRLLWGIIVDSDGNGFQGISGTGLYIGNTTDLDGPDTVTGGQQLRIQSGESSVLTDDYLYLSSNLTATGGVSDDSFGLAKPVYLTGLLFTGNVSTGDLFGIVWFDLNPAPTSLNATVIGAVPNPNVPELNAGLKYGFYLPAGNFTVLPPDAYFVDYSANFSGPEPLRNATYTLKTIIPEPSSGLLLVGAGSFLIARRRQQL